MNIGSESLYSNRQGVDTAGHNIANAETEGYSRQRVNLRQRNPSESDGNVIGNGAYVGNISRAHDKFIEKQLNNAIQDSSTSVARNDALQTIEQIFSTELESSVSDELSEFFNALQNLSTYPEEMPTRTNLREAASNMVSAFKRVDFSLTQHRADLDDKINGVTIQAADAVKQIASLNVAIQTLESGGGSGDQANDLRDQQDQLVRKLSEKMNISYYNNEHGSMVVRGPSQTLLVDGKHAANIVTRISPETGVRDITVFDSENGNPKNITEFIEKGEMRSLIDVRDKVIDKLLNGNNQLAANVVYHVNAAHRQGYGLGEFSEATGRNFFETSESVDGAALNLRLSDAIQNDVNAISVAATPNAPGDNIVVNEILRLKDQRIMDGGTMTFNEYYSNYVGKLGLDIERSIHEKEADTIILGDLEKRRESVSGVSLDEEAVNLLRWQTAFAASSKVITTVDEMLETVLSLKR